MAEYGGQMMGQQYGISEVGHSPAGMHRMPGQHSSPQQPLFHGQQHPSPQQSVYPGQHSSPQQPIYQGQHPSPQQALYQNQRSSPQQPNSHIMGSGQLVSQQQMLISSSQQMQMQNRGNLQGHQLTAQVLPQHGVTVMSQTGQLQQTGKILYYLVQLPVNSSNTAGQILQNQHQLLANQTHQTQQQPQQQQQQTTQQSQSQQQQQQQQPSMIVTSVSQQMMSPLSHGPSQAQQHQIISNSQNQQHQMMPSSSQQQHQMVSQSGPHQLLTTSSAKQHQMLATSQHQMISSQAQHQIMAQSPQFIQHQPVVAQQPVAQTTSFALPAQAHIRQQNPVYQQSSQYRVATPRFTTAGSENLNHNQQVYRGTIQRPPSIQRVQVGQSSAIRQALGHNITAVATSSVAVATAVVTGVATTSAGSITTVTTTAAPSTTTSTIASSTATAPTEPISLNGMKLLEKDALETLIKSVDPFETVEDDVSDALKQLVEEFVDEVVEQTARVARHRGSSRLESRDVQYVLEKRFKIFLPAQTVHGTQLNERSLCSKPPTVEAHRQRMNLIKKTLQKP